MSALEPEDAYLDDGLLVFTERYHSKRGTCCGNRCRHCPYGHANAPPACDGNAAPSAPIVRPAAPDGRPPNETT